MKSIRFLALSGLYLVAVYFYSHTDVMKWYKDAPLTWLKPVVEKFEKHLETQKGERVYVSLNQPLYLPGETVWFSVFLREDVQLKPSDISDIVKVQIVDPKGSVVWEYKMIHKGGVAQGDWEIPEDIIGGVYTLKAYTQWQQNDPNFQPYEKTFQIQKIVAPRLLMKLDFPKRGYGPGDLVLADFQAQKLNNTPLANASIEYQVKLAGKVVQTQKLTTDAAGKAQIQFKLPQDLRTPDGTLNIKIPFEGQTEAIARSIPINLDYIDLKFYPEGGDWIAGLKTRIAFEALNFYGKGSDVEGKILDNQGNLVTTFKSFHLGKGIVEMTPQAGKSYKAVLTQPSTISKEYPLPPVSNKGFILNVENEKKELVVTIRQNTNKKVGLIAQQRGKIYYSQEFPAQAEQVVRIPLQSIPAGVLHLTLFDEDLIERCERLVFVNPHKKLNIQITPDKKMYAPREKVTLDIFTSDEQGLGVPASLALSVVDDKILKMADDKQGHLLASLLLEQDVKGKIEEPNFYFDEKEPKAPQALDLLLMTRGWRRFTWKQINPNPNLTYKPEKSQFAGTVLQNGKPVPNAVVTLTIDGQQKTAQLTKQDGKFLFQNVSFNQYVLLEAEYGKDYNSDQYELNEYKSDVILELYDGRYKYAVGAAVDGAEGEDYETEGEAEGAPDAEGPDTGGGGAKPRKKVMIQPAEAPPLANKDTPESKPGAEKNEPPLQAKTDDTDQLFGSATTKVISKKKIAYGGQYYRAREFPVILYSTTETTVREDFRNTIYWNGNLETDNKGRASVSFSNNDAITTFAVVAEGVSKTGLPGHQIAYYACQKPFSMDIKVPTIVSMGDLVQAPLTLHNNTSAPLKGSLAIQTPKSWKLLSSLNNISIPPQSTQTLYIEFQILNIPEDSTLKINFLNQKGVSLDAFVQKVKTYSKGFPVSLALAGSETSKEYKINIGPAIEGTLQLTFQANPNPLAEALSGLENMIGVPSGCFEQTSYTNYPNVVIVRYAREYPDIAATIQAKAEKNLDIGYKRLISFETVENGYEWFGHVPPHEALTAYGLLQFRDMESVYASVDKTMVNRTANWLLSRRDGKGGFLLSNQGYDSFNSASRTIKEAYIVYSLTETGYAQNLQKEIDSVYENHKKSQDPYLSALCWNILLNTQDKRAEEVEKWLMSHRDEEGIWTGTTHSITYSKGIGLQVETTALVGLAMLKKPNPNLVELASIVKTLLTKKSPYGGMFGTTQGTVLTMKLLALFAQKSKRPRENGTLIISINGKKVVTRPIKTTDNGPISLQVPVDAFKLNATNTLKITYEGMKEGIPYTFFLTYNVKEPRSDQECKLQIQSVLEQKEAKMGDAVRMKVILKNVTQEGLPMSMAIAGIPGGLTPQPQQLKELQEKQVFDFYEIKDQYIAFYYRSLPPNASKEILLDLKADIPGSYESPASFAYLYYTPEYRHWHSAGTIKITK